MRKLTALSLALIGSLLCLTLHAQSFKLLKDINTQTNSDPANAINKTTSYAVLDGKAFFAADDGLHGRELWVTDGTTGGTSLFMDIKPGVESSVVNSIYTYKNKIYFFASANQFQQFWQSDGTVEGTVKLMDSLPADGARQSYTVFRDSLYFTVSGTNNKDELWATYGTKQSLHKIIDIHASLPGFNLDIEDLIAYNDKLFFTLNFGTQLWCTGGTEATTSKLVFEGFSEYSTFTDLQVRNNKLYFSHNGHIFSTGGDSANTTAVNEGYGVDAVTLLKDDVYAITSTDLIPGFNFYKANNASASKFDLIKALDVGSSLEGPVVKLKLNDSLLFFVVKDYNKTPRLWVTDGTAGGTKILVADSNGFSGFFVWRNKIYFSHNGHNLGDELWVTDGSVAGTYLVKNINPGVFGSSPQAFSAFDSLLLFAANTNVTGTELWKTDGTEQGTAFIKNINNTTTASAYISWYPDLLTDTINGRFIFPADDGVHGYELWGTDGTGPGTYLTKDIYPGTGPAFSQYESLPYFVRFKNDDYFFAKSPANYFSLWKTRGTPASTAFVSDVYQPARGILPGKLGATSKYLFAEVGLAKTNSYSSSEIDSVGNRLFSYDGVNAPVLLKKAFFSPRRYMFSEPNNFLRVGENIGFLVSPFSPAYGVELWKSDGTVAGTQIVKTIYPGIDNFFISVEGSASYNGASYFFMSSGFSNNPPACLWKTDLTTDGTKIIKKLSGSKIVVAHNKMFFTATDSAASSGLWVSDGTEEGTLLIKSLGTPALPGYISVMEEFNGLLYFSYSAPTGGSSLWRTDGTDTGTVQVLDSINSFIKGGNKLYYFRNNQVWQTAGTINEAAPLAGLDALGLTYRDKLLYAYDRLYFAGTSRQYGAEFYTTSSLLPVTMLSFTGSLQGNNSLLQWVTANEQNNSHFNVQRSLDGRGFVTIGNVNAHGGTKGNDYNYIDANVTALGVDKLYYRLQQVDLDGKFTYSKTIALNIAGNNQIHVTPNPAVGFTTVQSQVDMPGALIKLVDLAGRTLYSSRQNLQAGGKINIPLTGYAKGVYIITVEGNNKKKQEFRLVVN